MYRISFTNRFKKDMLRCQKRGMDITLVSAAIAILKEQGVLPSSYRPHKLTGDHAGQWECHLKPDWIMVWEQNELELQLLFLYTGTHSDIFKK
jgi:mRNA interferase YafQ